MHICDLQIGYLQHSRSHRVASGHKYVRNVSRLIQVKTLVSLPWDMGSIIAEIKAT